nr:hypothetical protein Iba_chr06aCG5930 [Ipomoea batatas]GMD05352.1 hypothetical protein Iba_chr06bCG5690 [Ipomoea batatas]GMD09217.1 hypothetical protein Iba_chr06dCG6040 [Ipomoea batatas]
MAAMLGCRDPSRLTKPEVSHHRCSLRHAVDNSSGVDAKPESRLTPAPSTVVPRSPAARRLVRGGGGWVPVSRSNFPVSCLCDYRSSFC